VDEETEEIKESSKLTPVEIASGRWKELGKRPNPGCRRCHGRGYIGFDMITHKVIECICVKRRPQ